MSFYRYLLWRAWGRVRCSLGGHEWRVVPPTVGLVCARCHARTNTII